MFEHDGAVRAAVRDRFGAKRLLVVGDLMLDRYLWGDVARISPEAPVPVLRLRRETEVAGGAANVTRNLVGLGLPAMLGGVVGTDAPGERLLAALAADGIDTRAILALPGRPTTTKTRVIGQRQQMLRIDTESTEALDADARGALDARVTAALADADLLLLSDYAKGVLSAPLCQRWIAAARARGLAVLIDPKGTDFDRYRGASLITPNRAELALALGLPDADLDTLLAAAARAREHLALEHLVVTLGELGMALIDASGTRRIPATAREVFDVSGAGDTVIAVFAAARAAGLAPADCARLANLGAGAVVGRVGTAPIDRNALLAAIDRDAALEPVAKLCDRAAARARLDGWRARGERIVFTNGCFDLLHAGHVSYLEQARRHGQRLVVGLNTDRSVRALKGVGRPVIGEADRARVLAGLAAVDAVVPFDEDTPLELIRALRPDVLVKGADYREDQVVGAAEVRAWGGELVLIPLLPERGTTRIIASLAQANAR